MFEGLSKARAVVVAAGGRKTLFGGPSAEGEQQQQPAVETHERPSAAEIQEARSALASFLRGFGLDRNVMTDALTEQLLAEAHAVWRAQPQRSLAQCALERTERRFEAWLGFVLGPETLDGRPALVVGRAAFLLCRGPAMWHELVLVQDELPRPFVEAMRAAAPPPTPVAAPGTMAAQSLESWSVADVAKVAAAALGEPLAWASGLRQLRAPIRLIRFGS